LKRTESADWLFEHGRGHSRARLQWQLRDDECSLAGGAAQVDRPAEGFHSVVETDQTRAFPGIRSADAVIANAHGGSAAQ
jgi:hypothetical protein